MNSQRPATSRTRACSGSRQVASASQQGHFQLFLQQKRCLLLGQKGCLLRQDRCLLLRQDRCLLLKQDRYPPLVQGAALSQYYTSVLSQQQTSVLSQQKTFGCFLVILGGRKRFRLLFLPKMLNMAHAQHCQWSRWSHGNDATGPAAEPRSTRTGGRDYVSS